VERTSGTRHWFIREKKKGPSETEKQGKSKQKKETRKDKGQKAVYDFFGLRT
jgi:hypothetical protein